MAKVLMGFIALFLVIGVNVNVYAGDDTVIDNCYQNLKTDINDTASGGILEISETGICEINETFVIDKAITLKVTSGFNFTLKLTNKVNSFIELKSNNITIDGFLIDANKNAYEGINIIGGNINISHNKINNIYYNDSSINKDVRGISYIPESNITASGTNVEFSHNEIYALENTLTGGVSNGIFINFKNTGPQKLSIRGNIFDNILGEENEQINITTDGINFESDIEILIENNSFDNFTREAIKLDDNDLNIVVQDNNYNLEEVIVIDENLGVWTIDKAEHLAKKVLYGVTEEQVQELLDAGSREAAVNILFPSTDGPDRTIYNSKISELLDEELLTGYSNYDMKEYYTFKKLEDPYQAKSKLFSIFEDTFSVDTKRDRIYYSDVEATYDLLYSHTLGNYKEMVKRNLYNNGSKGDYSLSEYLDLLNQTRPSSPNENYSREILQLFLMLEYKPTESEDNGDERNYTEDDLNSLAKIIFGFEADEETHSVTYNSESNTNIEVEFLDGELKSGDNFSFYNSASGTLDIQDMKTSINGNNGLPDNVIDYIFSKREEEIAIFLADKFYRFYIAENPSRSDLDIITNKIIENNFEIYPTIKWLLASDMMYKSKSLNDVVFKNPLELVIGTSKIFGLDSDNLDLRYSLQNLNWTPYNAGKIFGRDGFDDNSIFYTPYVATKWSSEASKLTTKLIENNISFIDNTITEPLELIKYLENKLYLGKELDLDTRNKLIIYLTHDKDGNEIVMNLTDQGYIIRNLQGVIYMMLNFPEYVLQSGYDIETSVEDIEGAFFNNDNKIIFIKASGGLDWLHAIIPKDEYSEYLELRSTGSITGTGLLSLNDDLYINSSLKPFKDLYDSGNLRVINRVGTPDHSRGHDSSSRKITSLNNKYEDDDGIFGYFIKNEDPSKTIILDGGTKPSILRSGKYMGIGNSAIYTINYGENYIDTDDRNYKINTLKEIIQNRDYIGIFGDVFINGAVIDSVAKESKANGGREGSGYNMEQRFTFLESLYNAGLGNASWMRADGGYDTHRNQKDYLNGNFDKVATRTADFFNRVKSNQDVTIVIYSEFGRTNKLNSSIGVDHGKGGGMFIISNNTNLLNNQLPNKVYGNNLVKDSKENYLGVGIDYRSVYTSLLKGVYSKDITTELGASYNINNYIDNTNPKSELLRFNHVYYNNSSFYTSIKFNIDDVNFFGSQGSNIKFEYWSDEDDVKEVSSYWLNRYRIGEKGYNIKLRLSHNKKYFYKITVLDNQYNKTYIDGNFFTPKINISNNLLEKNNSTFIRNYRDINFSGSLNLPNSSTGIILSNSGMLEYSGENNIKMLAGSGTYINQITGGSGSVWNGNFILPTFINKEHFIGSSAIYDGKSLSRFNIDKLIKIGASDLGIGMNLNKSVSVEVDGLEQLKNYKIIFSENGIDWSILENGNITKNGTKLSFNTNHFTYFALVETDGSGDIIDSGNIDLGRGENEDEDDNSENIGYSNSSGGGAARAIKDICDYGDFSPSYYDKTCGMDPDAQMIHDSRFSTGSMVEVALDELSYYDEAKYLLYLEIFKEDRTFDSMLDSKTIIIKKLREGFSIKEIGDYKLIHIKNSKYNLLFEKLADFILSKNYNNINARDELIVELNNLVVLLGLYKEEGIDKNIKPKIKEVLINKINNFSKLYNGYKILKKKIVKIKYTYTDKIKKSSIESDKEVIEDKNIIDEEESINLKIINPEYVYKVSSKSVILKSDVYWKNDIGVLYKGDIVEQITNIHPKGFFKIRVIESKEGLDGKEGYIFAKYLEE